MHIKFLRHGTGSAAKAAAYLLGERDHKGVDRDHVQVLIGDPTQVAAVADSLGTVHRYSSAVIAFHPDDRPTPEQIARSAGRLRGPRLRRPALRRVRVDRRATRQPGSRRRVHVHVLIARVELSSGLAYNPAPPSWRTDFDHVRDAWNHEQGWARPDDPTRARLVQPPAHEMFKAAAAAAPARPEVWIPASCSPGGWSTRSPPGGSSTGPPCSPRWLSTSRSPARARTTSASASHPTPSRSG